MVPVAALSSYRFGQDRRDLAFRPSPGAWVHRGAFASRVDDQ